MSKFKKGDKVKCIDANNTRLVCGHSYEVAETGSGWVAVYITGDKKDIFSSGRFVKLEGAEDMQTIKAGDKVTCIDNQYLEEEIKVGDIYTVSGFCGDAFYLEEKDKNHVFNKCRFKLAESNQPEAPKFNASGSKYLRDIQTTLDGKIDVYAVLMAFNVTSPARQHAIKKLLCAGIRGKNNELNDVKEANDAIEQDIQMLEAVKSEI